MTTLREALIDLKIKSAKKANEKLKNEIENTYFQFINASKKYEFACHQIVDSCKIAVNKDLIEVTDGEFVVKIIGERDATICALRTFCDAAFEARKKMDKLHDHMICLSKEFRSGYSSPFLNMIKEVKSYIPSCDDVLYFTTEEEIEFTIINLTECVGYETQFEIQMKVLTVLRNQPRHNDCSHT